MKKIIFAAALLAVAWGCFGALSAKINAAQAAHAACLSRPTAEQTPHGVALYACGIAITEKQLQRIEE